MYTMFSKIVRDFHFDSNIRGYLVIETWKLGYDLHASFGIIIMIIIDFFLLLMDASRRAMRDRFFERIIGASSRQRLTEKSDARIGNGTRAPVRTLFHGTPVRPSAKRKRNAFTFLLSALVDSTGRPHATRCNTLINA